MENNINEDSLCKDLENLFATRLHQPSGPTYKNYHKINAFNCFQNDKELEGICSLIETHAPTFRIKTTYRYDRILQTSTNSNQMAINKEHIAFDCPVSMKKQIENLKLKIEEMPKEWTLVQLTTQYNLDECLQIDISNTMTDPLHISVFNCGQNEIDPFQISVDAPTDISGAKIELSKEMHEITNQNKNLLRNHFGDVPLDKIGAKQKKSYVEHRNMLNIRLSDVEKQMEVRWLREWKCLFIGKFIDNNVDKQVNEKIMSILETDKTFVISKKIMYILSKILACSPYLSSNEITRAVHYCIPNNKELRIKMILMIKTESMDITYKNSKRYPVILIIDEKLDCFCWEMIDVLQDHPASRMPSLHFTYALFKEHEKTIVDGFKQISAKNGKFIINPGLDLKKMEQRLSKFFEYWLPEWKGLVGQTPTSDQFSEYLNGGDIFVYNGHGSGTQFLSGSKIQQLRVNGVVLLFGCGSVRMQSDSSLIEMHDIFHSYMIACSPCVVGMLWEVTDYDTDIMSTDLISKWIPSTAKVHWNQIDKAKWNKASVVHVKSPRQLRKEKHETEYEPELLRAINQARKAPMHNITKSAIVARGLPVKLCDISR